MKTIPRAAAALILLALVAAVYAPVAGHPFLPHDDPNYIEKNPVVSRGLTADGVAWAFTTFHAANWHPLTWLSHMADVSLFGLAPGPAHAVNAILHGANAVLLFLFLSSATGAPGRSLAAAALFAVHPLHVESVAWIAERKDVLCALFLFLALHAWLGYTRKPGALRLLAVAALHALALMAKPMAVTFPALLMFLDYWPLRRGPFSLAPSHVGGADHAPSLRMLLVEKIPLFLLSAASSVVTIMAQRAGGAVNSMEGLPLLPRVGNALLSYASYLGKAFFPASLAIFYPHPWDFPGGVSTLAVAASALLFLSLWGAALLLREKQPWLLAGLGWYTVALVPVIGLVQVGLQGMADRYAYLPLVGIYAAVVWGAGSLASNEEPELAGRKETAQAWWRKMAPAAVAVACVASLAIAARVQLSYWETPWRLFSHAVSVTGRNYQALGGQGVVLLRERKPEEAEGKFREAVAAWPGYGEGWGKLGLALLAQGRAVEAEGALRRSLSLGRGGGEEHQYLGVALLRQGRTGEAREWLLAATRLDPEAAEFRFNLAVSEAALGMTAEAEGSYREAIRLRPGFGKAHNNLGDLLLKAGRAGEAAEHFREALRIDPQDGVAQGNLERALGAVEGRR